MTYPVVIAVLAAVVVAACAVTARLTAPNPGMRAAPRGDYDDPPPVRAVVERHYTAQARTARTLWAEPGRDPLEGWGSRRAVPLAAAPADRIGAARRDGLADLERIVAAARAARRMALPEPSPWAEDTGSFRAIAAGSVR